MTISKYESGERFKGQSVFEEDIHLEPARRIPQLWSEYTNECIEGGLTSLVSYYPNAAYYVGGSSYDYFGMDGVSFAMDHSGTLTDVALEGLSLDGQQIADFIRYNIYPTGGDMFIVANPDLSNTDIGKGMLELGMNTRHARPANSSLVFTQGIEYVNDVRYDLIKGELTATQIIRSSKLPQIKTHAPGAFQIKSYFEGPNSGRTEVLFTYIDDALYEMQDRGGNKHVIEIDMSYALRLNKSNANSAPAWNINIYKPIKPHYMQFK